MSKPKIDWILNVFFPLAAGTAIYLIPTTVWMSATVRHFLPDALWAYAFISAILLIWNRKVNRIWVFSCFLLAAATEWCQYKGVIGGTADPFDLVAYYLSILAGLVMNPFFRSRLQPNRKPETRNQAIP